MNILLFLPLFTISQLDGLPAAPALVTNLGFRLQPAQEILYRGLFTEESNSSRVQFQRSYRVENRVLVLEQANNRWEIACLTTLKQRGNPGLLPTVGSDNLPSSMKMEIVQVDQRGKIIASPGVSLPPLDGPTTLETGFLLEIMKTRLGENDSWEVSEDGRPVRQWTVAGTEIIQSVKCLKLTGLQQTEDWEKPRADRRAWRRTDTFWLNPQLGAAQRYERVIEIKEPAHNVPTQKSTLRCDIETNLVYPGRLFEDRKKDIQLSRTYKEGSTPFLENPSRYSAQLRALRKRVESQLELNAPTPYRGAIQQTQAQIEAALAGEFNPQVIVPVSLKGLNTVQLGQKAPDFIAHNLRKAESVRLERLQGKPLLLLFYNPKSPLSQEVLSFGQKLQTASKDSLAVVGMSVVDDAALVRKQLDELKITFTVLDGSGLRTSYNLQSTPVAVLMDAKGVVRLNALGWGLESRQEIEEGVVSLQGSKREKLP